MSIDWITQQLMRWKFTTTRSTEGYTPLGGRQTSGKDLEGSALLDLLVF